MATFNDSAFPYFQIRVSILAKATISAETPFASPPSMSTTGFIKFMSSKTLAAFKDVATI